MMEKENQITTGKRNLRLIAIEERIKRVRSLENELDLIYIQLRGLGYTTLDKPLRNGWYRTLILRQDIAKHKKAYVYQEILDKIGEVYWGRDKKYADKAWKKNHDRNWFWYERSDLRYVSKKVYSAFSTSAKRCFVKVKIKINFRYRRVYICNLPKYYFVKAYKRAYITKRKIIAPALESRAKEIENELNSQNLYVLSGYHTYNYKHYFNPNRRRRRKTNAALQSFNFHLLESLNDKEYC